MNVNNNNQPKFAKDARRIQGKATKSDKRDKIIAPPAPKWVPKPNQGAQVQALRQAKQNIKVRKLNEALTDMAAKAAAVSDVQREKNRDLEEAERKVEALEKQLDVKDAAVERAKAARHALERTRVENFSLVKGEKWKFRRIFGTFVWLGRIITSVAILLGVAATAVLFDDEHPFFVITALMSLLCIALLIVLCRTSVLIRKDGHSFKFSRWYDCETGSLDLRADSISMAKLKHENALLCYVRHTHWKDGERESQEYLVSMELLTQLSTAANMHLSASEETTWDRITYTAKTIQTINIDRGLVLEGHNVVQTTCIVALGMWKAMSHDVKHLDFPRSL